MKIRFFLCLTALLLVLSGCRRVAPVIPSPGGTAPGTATPSIQQYATASPAGSASVPSATAGAIPAIPSPSSAASASSSTPAGNTPAGVTPADTSSGTGAAASEQEVNATLDDILKQLSDLDQLFSQMDNVKESDLG